MSENFKSGPGDKEMNKIIGLRPLPSDSSSESVDRLLVKSKGGGLGGAAQKTLEDRARTKEETEPAPETYEFPKASKEIADSAKTESAVLSDARWAEPDTLFHQEAEISVHLGLPKGKEHITKVQVDLLAKTSSEPIIISKGEGRLGPIGWKGCNNCPRIQARRLCGWGCGILFPYFPLSCQNAKRGDVFAPSFGNGIEIH
jgi:hypothetical protein